MKSQSLADVIEQQLLEHAGERIVSFEHQGKRYWLKQAEKLTGAMRFLKQQPDIALHKEIATLQSLAAKGAAVPQLVSHGSHYLVVADVGRTVTQWAYDPKTPKVQLQQVVVDSAIALAELHQLGLAHGRPALRDISWQDGQVAFIDFEANQSQQDIHDQQVRDLLVYIHSLYRYIGEHEDIVDAAIEAYRQAQGETIWQAARVKMKAWQWANWIVAPLKNIGGKDLRPIYWLLKHFK
ncbi:MULTISPECIES: serine/threonine protein phosphatase [Shewanella]|uniref:serine/threonine protein phosphatase n=1 Tax=Shewanella TaxID=22 RepID=UPI00048A7DA6|nr:MULTISPECIES: serine/threonine protein phosphatase [Shewanella]QLE85895.1 serine/threonine protein phosphatase [Shewanella sp. Scap07]